MNIKIIFICPVLNKEIITDKYYVYCDSHECDTCGSHGTVILDVNCECEKKSHEITIREW